MDEPRLGDFLELLGRSATERRLLRSLGSRLEATLRQLLAYRPSEDGLAESPYRVLGVRPDAPDQVIKAAYRALSKVYHPDGQSPDPERMKAINVAYEQIRKARSR